MLDFPSAERASPSFPNTPPASMTSRAMRVGHMSSGADGGRRPSRGFRVFGDMLRAPERYLEWGWETELWMAMGNWLSGKRGWELREGCF